MGIVQSTLPTEYFDVAIIGAGPVGLAIAIELARLDLTTIVVDRRPPPADDSGLRPQLLVARSGDLANLAHLGVENWLRSSLHCKMRHIAPVRLYITWNVSGRIVQST